MKEIKKREGSRTQKNKKENAANILQRAIKMQEDKLSLKYVSIVTQNARKVNTER